MDYLGIGLGGLAGALARFVVSQAVARAAPAFALGTLVVNISGTFLLGLLSGLGEAPGWATPSVRAALMVGFLGAYTTFSTWSVDTLRLLEEGAVGPALFNVLASVGLGLGAAWLGLLLGRAMS